MSPKQPEISSPSILAEYSEEIIQELFNVKLPLNWKILRKEEKSELLLKWAREAFPHVPESLIPMTVGLTVDGDSGIPMDERPDWLDHEKFLRGQKFAQDNIFGLFFSVLLTLFSSMSFEEGFKPLVASKQTSEPYKAFKSAGEGRRANGPELVVIKQPLRQQGGPHGPAIWKCYREYANSPDGGERNGQLSNVP
ncbi:Protein of unknown function [Cotesia congregata]|uniref:Uncharacterized protein n=1 Tax=Cotesia congregata TaxID=51543 RepID=A0A8J2MA17_COTCN|nr:Protein of unknown function [Cotesia congregata]